MRNTATQELMNEIESLWHALYDQTPHFVCKEAEKKSAIHARDRKGNFILQEGDSVQKAMEAVRDKLLSNFEQA